MVFRDKQENFSDKSLPYKKFTAQKGQSSGLWSNPNQEVVNKLQKIVHKVQVEILIGKVNNLVAAVCTSLKATVDQVREGISWRDNFQPSK